MSEAIYCFDTATVRFAIYPWGVGGGQLIAEIGEDPLRDLFGATGGGDSLVAAYERNASTINSRAITRYRESPYESVRLETLDFELAGQLARAFAD